MFKRRKMSGHILLIVLKSVGDIFLPNRGMIEHTYLENLT